MVLLSCSVSLIDINGVDNITKASQYIRRTWKLSARPDRDFISMLQQITNTARSAPTGLLQQHILSFCLQ